MAILIVFQSCVVYKDTSSTISDATSDKDMPIKIITKDGVEYKIRWIEEKDGNIISIKNVEREYFDKDDIFQYVILDPEPHTVPLNIAVNHDGIIRMLVSNDKKAHISHEFLKISEIGERILGYKMTGKDTVNITIPIDQIEKIELKDKGRSMGRTAGLIVGVVFGVGIIILIAAMANECADGGCSYWS